MNGIQSFDFYLKEKYVRYDGILYGLGGIALVLLAFLYPKSDGWKKLFLL